MEDEGGGEKKMSRRGDDDHYGDEEAARAFPMVPLHHKKSEDEKSESESEIDEVDEEDAVTIPSTSDEDSPSERNAGGRKMPRAFSTTISVSNHEGSSGQGEKQDRLRQPWNMLNFFRTEENERAPSRIRSTSKGTLASVHSTFLTP